MSYFFEIVIILVLIILNGIFAMAEFAMVSAKKPASSNGRTKGMHGQQQHLELKMNPRISSRPSRLALP
jgi:putative hemolysin